MEAHANRSLGAQNERVHDSAERPGHAHLGHACSHEEGSYDLTSISKRLPLSASAECASSQQDDFCNPPAPSMHKSEGNSDHGRCVHAQLSEVRLVSSSRQIGPQLRLTYLVLAFDSPAYTSAVEGRRRLHVLRNALDLGAPISPQIHENNLEALENTSTHLKPFVPFSRGSFQVVHDRVRELSGVR